MKRLRYTYTLIILLAVLAGCTTVQAAAPDVRAVYLDFRTQVMTPDAMKELARKAADDGMNAVVVEWEASFPFEENAVLCNRFAFSRSEVRAFIDCCAELGLDVIPVQNCYGHA